ncbi:glyoxalase [Cellulomonas carbonis]|uniref:Extradiol dioxygenase n=2 Tax=Cellulomonas carbonis TaxID=1386092 RepID=A0A0A0BRL9_9CELL|nr:extradiol dioxygenase [Cellulomonas carbonis T26]GGC07167.1 glyoxalase [Cellulomonas carbonis]
MERMIFVNLPVRDLQESLAFYTGLGFTVNEQYSDENAACIVVSDTICVMLLVHARFADFLVGTQITDARTHTQVLNALTASSRDEVDRFVENAVAHGGKARTPIREGGMYGHSVTDPDGHVWEIFHMADPTAN